ncbi:hypothetical protein D3C81_1482410 [compost metagenome]
MAQFCDASSTDCIDSVTTAASAPCERVAPVAAVSFRPADIVPVAYVIVLASPAVAEVMMKRFCVVSNSTVTLEPIPVSIRSAACAKLVAVLRSILAEVCDVPSTDRVRTPLSSLS